MRLLAVFALLIIYHWVSCASVPSLTKRIRAVQTSILNKNATGRTSYIALQVLDKPHHLFIGRCKPEDETLHEETIILNNDGKSQVAADIRMDVAGQISITCAKVLDQIPGGGGYPIYVGGGVGQNYIIFNVTTDYGKGFNFYVQIKGRPLDKEAATEAP